MTDWLPALGPLLTAITILILPGLIVRFAGWDAREPLPYFFVPALSAAVVAVSANVASFVHLPWSPLPVALLTVVAAIAAYALRRWVGRAASPRPARTALIAGAAGLVLAAAVLIAQLCFQFVGPENISQTFDNVVHLNSIRFVLDAQDASAVTVGRVSDIGFYPNGWHSVVSLVAELTGASIPSSVNAANLAIGGVVWPASAMALGGALLGARASVLLASAALSTGFGAFPSLLLSFGVLYPNTMAYALLPAALAALVLLLHARGRAQVVRSAVLLLVVTAGLALAHPNAFLAGYAIGAALTLWSFILGAIRRRDRAGWLILIAVTLALAVVGAGLWRFSRTPYAMSRWGNWQTMAQAAGEAALMSPRGYPLTLVISALIVVGLVAVARRPRTYLAVALPLFVAAGLFILASGLPSGTFVRELLTNPWYNDSYRLAALLPVAGLPVAVLGGVVTARAASRVLRHWRTPAAGVAIVGAAAALVLFVLAGTGANVTAALRDGRLTYETTDGSSLLTTDEYALLTRLPSTTDPDALIAGNPWTGASLAYALGDRQVVERHIFGNRTEDELYLDEHLSQIDSDPEVCEIVDRIGVTHVLDFGDQNVFNDPNAGLDRRGLDDLPPSAHLQLIDSAGDSARLFRVTGC